MLVTVKYADDADQCALLPQSKKDPSLNPQVNQVLSAWSSPRVYMGSLWLLLIPPTIQRHGMLGPLLTLICLYVWCEWLPVSICHPSDRLETCPGFSQPLALTAGIGSSTSATLKRTMDKGLE